MKVYVLTIGRDLYYASKDYADAEYEKQYSEEETFVGRKLGIKMSEVNIDVNKPEEEHRLVTGCTYKTEQILDLL